MTRISIILSLALSLVTDSCSVEGNPKKDYVVIEEQKDSVEDMIKFISMVDSTHMVEQVSHNFVKMKETNQKLENELTETKQELEETKQELVETQEVVKSITGDNSSSTFELLPIEVPKTNSN